MENADAAPRPGTPDDGAAVADGDALVEEWLRDEKEFLFDLTKSFGLSQESFKGFKRFSAKV